MDVWIDVWIFFFGLINGLKDGWMDGQKDRCMYEYFAGWMDDNQMLSTIVLDS